jgi:hypothetical protein
LTLLQVGDKIPFESLVLSKVTKGAGGCSPGVARGAEQGEDRCGGTDADRQQAEHRQEVPRLGWQDQVAEVNPGHAGLMSGFRNPVTRKEMVWATNGSG